MTGHSVRCNSVHYDRLRIAPLLRHLVCTSSPFLPRSFRVVFQVKALQLDKLVVAKPTQGLSLA